MVVYGSEEAEVGADNQHSNDVEHDLAERRPQGGAHRTERGRMDLSRFCAAPSARLGHFPFEGDRAFPAQC